MMNNRKLKTLFGCLLFVLVLQTSCDPNHGQGGFQIREEQEIAWKRMALAGDRLAYNQLVGYYGLNGMYHESFLISFIVANRYENAEAYHELYWGLVYSAGDFDLERIDMLNGLDRKSRYYAVYYLLKSYELGYDSASECAEIFGKKTGFPKSGVYLDSIMLVSR